jgi:hypothetical protein
VIKPFIAAKKQKKTESKNNWRSKENA